MNKLQQTVMSMLKPKVKAFGFNKKVVKSIAAEIADKLDIEEDASDEDVNAKIEVAIAAVLPFMPMIQSQANSQFDEWKKAQNPNEEEEEEDDDSKAASNKSTKTKEKKTDESEPAWFKAYRESMEKQIADLKGERVTYTRKSKLENLLKGTKSFGDSKLRDFRRMRFDTDDDFDEFYAEVEADLKAFNQERANAGLEKLGLPIGGVNNKKKEEKPDVLSEDEIKAIAAM